MVTICGCAGGYAGGCLGAADGFLGAGGCFCGCGCLVGVSGCFGVCGTDVTVGGGVSGFIVSAVATTNMRKAGELLYVGFIL